MKTDDFDFYLPEELIAQTPISNRSDSKLLILDKNTGEIKHEVFHNIINYLDSNDILVLNDTKVVPARIYGIKEKTGAKIELLILKNIEKDIYECLVKPARRIHVDDIIDFTLFSIPLFIFNPLFHSSGILLTSYGTVFFAS